MNFSRTREFWVIAGLLLFSRGLDLFVTAWYSPDLSLEANPLVSLLHLHWPGLLTATLLITAGLLYCLYYDLFSDKTVFPAERDLSFRAFADLHWFGRRRLLIFYLIAFARNGDLRLKFIGYAGSRLLIITSFLVTGCWIAMHASETFSWLYHLAFPWVPYGLLVPGAIALLHAFLRREYGIYRQLSAAERPDDQTGASPC